MRDWIVIGVLYVLLILEFRLFGGIGSAIEALRRWGEASSAIRRTARSSS